ncbi:DVUA0089 family protein [Phormidium sp. FACHB-592]|uniref:DVUA0089 family protein n=1 Tax=Stenomitos frigidus AS-A4 TaxID=2933935 RepID=A0ABV0KP26_9CYAN|nr:DVUA0089 family protein [Phormidium sp. FACHB-592]MBD2072891.1 DVUA0089 family protein [Phormidium sp. FACHB-592]
MQRRDRAYKVSLWLLASFALASFATRVQAQVVPDNTLGNGNNSVTSATGNRTDITGGAGRGSALFHSFERFNISPNEQVYFANPTSIRNIFSRVTGGSLSNIDGLLGVAGSANLFFMNPNGIIFGPNARLDVSGSFLATTANALEFPDNQKFAATGDRAVPLVEVNLSIGLQFGANPPAMLTNQGNLFAGQDLTLTSDRLTLLGQLVAGRNLTLKAEDTVQIRDGTSTPFLALSGGNTLIQGNNGIDIFALNSATPSFQSYGSFTLISDGIISADAHFLSGGNFSMLNRAGQPGKFVSIYDPIILVNGDVTFGDYEGTALKVEATGSITTGRITITGPDPNFAGIPTTIGRVNLTGTTNVDSADISNGFGAVPTSVLESFLGLAANTLTGLGNGTATEGSALRASFNVPAVGVGDTAQFDWNFITSDVAPYNDFSFVTLTGPDTNIVNTLRSRSASPSTSPFQQTALAPGRYTLGIGVVDVLDASVDSRIDVSNIVPTLTRSTDPDAPTLGRSSALILRSGATITTPFTVLPTSTGGATFNSGGTLPTGSIQVTGINTSSATGAGGPVILDAQGGNISFVSFDPKLPPSINTSSSFDTGTGGSVSLIATGDITLPNTRILSTGRAGSGNVTITGANVSLTDGTLVDAGAIGTNGISGNVFITAQNGGSINLNQSAVITSINTGAQPSRDLANVPPEGNITLQAGSISFLSSVLNASTNGGRNGGTVLLQGITNSPLNSVSLDSESAIVTTVDAQAGDPTGTNIIQGGNIQITSGTLALTNGSSLQAQNLSSQNTRAGNITLDISGADSATTPALNISGIGSTRLPSGIFASNEADISASGGGNITVNVPNGTMGVSDRAVLSTQNRSDVTGGSITATVQNLQISSGGQFIASTTGSGAAGSIVVNATGTVDISGSATPFPAPLTSPFNQPGNPTTVAFPGTFNAPTNNPTTQPNIESSDRFQHQTVTANGTDQFVYYSFEVSTAGSQAIFDIDGDANNNDAADVGSFDTELFLFNATTGELLAQSDDSDTANGGTGSSSVIGSDAGGQYDSYINYVFSTPGEYVLGVGKFSTSSVAAPTFLQGTAPATTDTYNLQVSLEAPGQSQGLIPNQGLNSGLFAQALSTGRGGSITVQAATLGISNNAEINASTSSSGNGGSVNINNVGSVTLNNNANISANTSPSSGGNGGSISITNAGSVALTNNSNISANTEGDGIGGSIEISSGLFSLSSNSALNATTTGNANGGSVSITTTNTPGSPVSTPILQIDGGRIFAGVESPVKPNFSDTTPGIGGNITLTANNGSISMTNLALVDASTNSDGRGGDVLVQTTGGGAVSIISGSRIEAQTRGFGAAGNIQINAPDIFISGAAAWGSEPLYSGLYVSAQNQNSAPGGSISVNTATPGQRLVVSEGAVLSALNRSINPGGSIAVNVESIELLNGGQLVTAAESTGQAGNITIETPNLLISGTTNVVSRRNVANDSGELLEAEPNNLLIGSQPISNFSLLTNSNTESSTVIPHVTVSGNGDGTFDYYSFNATTGNRAIFDTDSDLDTRLFLFNGTTGELLAQNDDSNTSLGGQGSNSTLDSYIDYTFTNPGLYIIGVGKYDFAPSGTTPNPTTGVGTVPFRGGDTYILQASIDQRNTRNANQASIDPSNTTNVSRVTSSGLFAQSTAVGGAAGSITVNSTGTGQVILNNGGQISGSTVSGQGGSINLNGLSTLQVANSLISTSTTGDDGSAGAISVNAASVGLSGVLPGGILPSGTAQIGGLSAQADQGTGSSGQIAVNTSQLTVQNRAAIAAATDSGIGNNITLSGVDTLQVSNNSNISASTESGIAGNITLNTTASPAATVVLNDGSIAVTAELAGGRAGSVTLNARSIDLQNNSDILASNVSAPSNVSSGDITLNRLNTLNLNNSLISASTQSGVAGNVSVNGNGQPAAQAVTLSGTGQFDLNDNDLIDRNETVGGIIATATNGGNAGAVSINTTSLDVNNGASVAVGSANGDGTAGSVDIRARTVTLNNAAQISAETDAGGASRPADITLQGLQTLTVNNSLISSSTQSGTAGNVEINATGQVLFNGTSTALRDSQGNSRIDRNGNPLGGLVAEAKQGGTAGDVTITAGQFTVQDGARASVSSPDGQAGSLSVTTNDLRLNRGTLEAIAGAGDGANITLKVAPGGLLLLRNGSLISANANNQANGGNLIIDAPYIIGQTFENSDIVANAVRGQGGKIDIKANAIVGLRFRPKQTPLSDITASSDFGINGSVNLNTLSTDVTRGVATPPVIFTDVSQLNKSACEAVGAKAAVNSELRIAGQGGVTLSPTAPLPAQQTSSDWVSLDVSPQVQTNVTFSNGATVALQPGQTYQVQATCIKSWKEQQRSLL